MTSQLAIQILGVACGLGGLAGTGAYIWVVLKRRRWLNSAGLLLTSLGLMQLSLLVQQNTNLSGLIQGGRAVALILSAMIVQWVAAVRARTPWDGVDRRGGEEGGP
jgi:hypothetical protein